MTDVTACVGDAGAAAVAHAAPDVGALDDTVGAHACVTFVLPGGVVFQDVVFPSAAACGGQVVNWKK